MNQNKTKIMTLYQILIPPHYVKTLRFPQASAQPPQKKQFTFFLRGVLSRRSIRVFPPLANSNYKILTRCRIFQKRIDTQLKFRSYLI